MIKISLVGDIGSGKTYISKLFKVNCFCADMEVKKLYKSNRRCFMKLKKKFPQFIKTFPIKKNELSNIIKNKVIKYIDKFSLEVETTDSVNTIYKSGNNIIGHNTDVAGFELGLRHSKINVLHKSILILGAGGVVPSIIYSLLSMGCKKIFLSNRTIEKAENIKKKFNEVEILKWKKIPDFDIVINATSVGLKGESLDLDFNTKDKVYYDVIYNPKETQFLKKARENGNRIENGKFMFIYQANQSFSIWNNIIPKIDEEVLKILE